MQPIVSFCGSPTYELSKYLTTVLKPLTNESRHKLQSTENFIDAIKTIQIPDDYKLVHYQKSGTICSRGHTGQWFLQVTTEQAAGTDSRLR